MSADLPFPFNETLQQSCDGFMRMDLSGRPPSIDADTVTVMYRKKEIASKQALVQAHDKVRLRWQARHTATTSLLPVVLILIWEGRGRQACFLCSSSLHSRFA